VRFRQKEKLKIPKRSYSELFQSPEVKEKKKSEKLSELTHVVFIVLPTNVEE